MQVENKKWSITSKTPGSAEMQQIVQNVKQNTNMSILKILQQRSSAVQAQYLRPGLCIQVGSPDINVKAPSPSLLKGMCTIHNCPVHEVSGAPTLHAVMGEADADYTRTLMERYIGGVRVSCDRVLKSHHIFVHSQRAGGLARPIAALVMRLISRLVADSATIIILLLFSPKTAGYSPAPKNQFVSAIYWYSSKSSVVLEACHERHEGKDACTKEVWEKGGQQGAGRGGGGAIGADLNGTRGMSFFKIYLQQAQQGNVDICQKP